MDGIEHRLSGFTETDRSNDPPVSIEFENSVRGRIVVGLPHTDLHRSGAIHRNSKDSSFRLGAEPLALEFSHSIENLDA